MDLILSEEQRFIREEARRLLADRVQSAQLRAVAEEGSGIDAALWSTVAEMGWPAITVPEAFGGLGLGRTELVLLMEAAGERLAPLPLWSTACLAVPVLLAVGSQEAQATLLPRIAAGAAATVAAGEGVVPLLTARAEGGRYLLDGRVPFVADGEAAEIILAPARLDGGTAWFALPRGTAQIRRLSTLDATRQMAELVCSGVMLDEGARVDGGGSPSPSLDVARLGLAAEVLGVARGVMDLTLAYVAERVQFGRTIASFQAVKHRCARLEVDLAEARALVYGAAAQPEGAAGLDLEIAAALALASDLAFRAAEEAIQLHGGVGFTWEYDPHLYFKRAQAARVLLGDPDDAMEAIAAHLLDGEAAA